MYRGVCQDSVYVARSNRGSITGDKSHCPRVRSPDRDTCPLMAGRVTGWRSLPSQATGRLYLLAATCTAFGKLDFEHGICPQVHSRKHVHVVLSPPRAATLCIYPLYPVYSFARGLTFSLPSSAPMIPIQHSQRRSGDSNSLLMQTSFCHRHMFKHWISIGYTTCTSCFQILLPRR